MRKTPIVFVAVLTALALIAPTAVAADATAVTQEEPTCEYPLELEDATGETVTIEEEPDSVVALGPSDAQILHEIGAEEKVDGMPVGPATSYLDADEELDITQEDGFTPSEEQIVDRDPDVVLAANIFENDEVVDQLRDAGLTVYVFPTEESLDGVEENVRLTGQIVGECDGAEETVEWMDERLEIIERAVEGEDRPLAYYVLDDTGYTAGEGTFSDEILTTAGVENLAAEVGIEFYDQISEEVVVEENPEWIVYGESWGDEPPVGEATTATTAYQEEQFVAVNSNYMDQPGPYVVFAIEEIVQEIHSDAYAEAEAELEETDDANATDGDGSADDDSADDNSTDDQGAEDDTIPGFGVPVAVAALLAAAFVRVRRH